MRLVQDGDTMSGVERDESREHRIESEVTVDTYN
jgi:hypothetical protein